MRGTFNLRNEVKRSVAKIRRGRAAQNSTGKVHTFSDGNKTLAKRDPGSSGSVSLDHFYRLGPVVQMWSGGVNVLGQREPFIVIFDTGSPAFILPSSECEDENCDGHRKYDRALSSSTSESEKREDFTISYADGSTVKGKIYTDTVTIAGFTEIEQAFGAATQYPPLFAKDVRPSDGVMGLAFEDLSYFNGRPLMQSLRYNRKFVDPLEPVFTFKLTKSDGQLYIGEILKEHYSGAMNWVGVDYKRVCHSHIWFVVDDCETISERFDVRYT